MSRRGIAVAVGIRRRGTSRLTVLIAVCAGRAHPEGIEFKRLSDYREELTRYYMATAKLMDKEKIIEGVDHLVNPLDNAINEKCSRIKKVFLDMMDEYTASYYIISSHTQKHIAGSSRIWYQRLKVITLPRELVVYSKA